MGYSMKLRVHANGLPFSSFFTSLLSAWLLGAVSVIALAGSASAGPWSFVGARHQAMGGAGVAVSDDSNAAYWNPANLAHKKAYDVQLSVTLDGNIENNALERLSRLIEDGENVDALISSAGGPPGLTDGQRSQIVGFLEDLGDFGKSGEAVHVGVNVGLAGRANGLGFSAMSHTTGTVFPNVDPASLAVVATAGALADLLNCGACPAPTNQALADEILAADGTGLWDQAGADNYVRLFEDAGADTTKGSTSDLMKNIANQTALAAAGGGGGTLAAGDTGALVGGLSTQEFGISYGLAIPVPFFEPLDKKISVGATAKYIMGITFVSFTGYSGSGDAGDVLAGVTDFDQSNIDHNFGLDLGASYRPFEWLTFGLTARNVNSPEFDAKNLGSITLPAQVRIGTAVEPIENLLLAFDFDATENQIATLPGFKSRIVSLGSEYAIPMGDNVDLALRFGAFSNVSGQVNQDWGLTGGLGLRLWQFVMDLSVGGSPNRETITTGTDETTDLPTRINMGLTLKWEKSI